jgi:hypothetical protein
MHLLQAIFAYRQQNLFSFEHEIHNRLRTHIKNDFFFFFFSRSHGFVLICMIVVIFVRGFVEFVL